MNKNKLAILLSLLDDPDEEIYQNVEKKLIELPASSIPLLENYWLDSNSLVFQKRIENIINKIQFLHVKENLIKWSNEENPNLINGAILINQSYNPTISTNLVRKNIYKIKHDIALELNDQLTALEKIKIFNHFFFNIHNYQALPPGQPTNWDGDIGTVIKQKHGNYIILSIIYSGIAQELGIPVFGIGLPNSVLLCCKNERYTEHKRTPSDSVLFYINPVDKGTVLIKKDLQYIITSKNIKDHPSHYLPTSNTCLIKRLLKHEISVYKKLKLDNYIPNFKELYKVIE